MDEIKDRLNSLRKLHSEEWKKQLPLAIWRTVSADFEASLQTTNSVTYGLVDTEAIREMQDSICEPCHLFVSNLLQRRFHDVSGVGPLWKMSLELRASQTLEILGFGGSVAMKLISLLESMCDFRLLRMDDPIIWIRIDKQVCQNLNYEDFVSAYADLVAKPDRYSTIGKEVGRKLFYESGTLILS